MFLPPRPAVWWVRKLPPLGRGRLPAGTLSGPLYWATGDYYPERTKQTLIDAQVVADAIDREWGRQW